MSTLALRVDGLHVAIGPHEVVRGVDLRIAPGEVLGLVGESGSGKSLTALALMRLLPPAARLSSGRVMLGDQELTDLSGRAINRLRGGRMGMIFQDPLTALNPALTIGRQLGDALRAHRNFGPRAAADRARELLATVGITRPAERLAAYPHEFSGGMRQRVMIALAVANNPSLLIADEPTTALDVTVQAQVMDLLAHIRETFGVAVLFISHNLDLVAEIADSVSVMYAGRVVESGPVQRLFADPQHPYTRRLIACIPRLDDPQGDMPTIPGLPPRLDARPAGCAFAPRCDRADLRCATEPPPIHRDGDHMAECWYAGR